MNFLEVSVNSIIDCMDLDSMNSFETFLNSKKFKNKIKSPGLVVFEFENQYITIQQNRFIFNYTGDYEKSESIEKIEFIWEALKFFPAETPLRTVTIRFVDRYDSKNNDSFGELKKLSTIDFSKSPLSDFIGVGYRFIMKKNDVFSEFKVEPSLKNNELVFVEGIYNSKDLMLESFVEFCNNAFDDMTIRIESFKSM